MLLTKCRPVPILLAFAWALSWGCAQTDVRLGEEAADAQAPSTGFTPRPESDAAAGEAAAPDLPMQTLCIGTECPAPFATCTAEERAGVQMRDRSRGQSEELRRVRQRVSRLRADRPDVALVDGACELECMNDPDLPDGSRNCNGEARLTAGRGHVSLDPRQLRRLREGCAAGSPASRANADARGR